MFSSNNTGLTNGARPWRNVMTSLQLSVQGCVKKNIPIYDGYDSKKGLAQTKLCFLQ